MDPQRMISGDSSLVEKIVNYLKSKGIFDEFRHECLADVDTKSSCQNLSQRVDGYAAKFLANETWHPDLNKNELRNKLRRHIDESGMLAVGADHVVEQVINPKIHQLFLPKIIEVVHQYMKEQNELFNKKLETSFCETTFSENVSDTSDSNKGKSSALDPIADILSFSSLRSKTPSISASKTETPTKTDYFLPKHSDGSKTEKKKEEKSIPFAEKNILESPNESPATPVINEGKALIDKEKIKKEEPESSPEMPKKFIKDESKLEKKKSEDIKPLVVEISSNAEENKPSTSATVKPISSGKKDAEENKASTPTPTKSSSSIKKEAEECKTSTSAPSKPSSSTKKDGDKSKIKSKSSNIHKSYSSSSNEVKKPKKDLSDKSSEKYVKAKSSKPSKDLSSPSKNVKNISKDEKSGEISKSKSSDSSSSKTSESSVKKSMKSSSGKKDPISSKHKSHSEKTEKYKGSKTSDKNEQNIPESSSSEKGSKNIHYSSSYDSSQGSDQDKSSSSSLNKDRQKHFSKHAKKESSEKYLNKSKDASSQKRKDKDSDGSPTKNLKNETNSAQEKFKESLALGEAAKISSRSNSFGSTSSVSCSSNTSKDNVVSNSDETSESGKDKKKKQSKEKEACHNFKTLPPPPPPPPPSSSLSCELTSADISSMEDTQSSSDQEHSSCDESSDKSSSDSESESKESALNTLNETLLNNSSSDDINEFYDIFLYSSSSSEFEGFGDSPEKEAQPEEINESDVSVSSVHTSDLSSFDDELSDEDFFINNESQPGSKKRLTLKEAEKLLKSKAISQTFDKSKSTPVRNKVDDVSSSKTLLQKSFHISSEGESSPSEPKRSLRRERKLNPRYASSEYTSIFNSRKETFITKQSTPYGKNQPPTSSPKSQLKLKKEPSLDTDKSLKKNSLTQTKVDDAHQDKVERSLKTKRKSSAALEEDKIFSENSKMSSSDELDSFMDKEKLFRENDKSCQISSSEHFKLHFKFKSQNNSNFSVHSYPVKRKLTEAEETAPAKRPYSRASVDSTSSECVPNENKPFNSEKHCSSDEKITKSSDFKGSDLTDTIKKDMFCKQRTNNNGDILGQKDIFSKSPRGKGVIACEKKPNEPDKSKELNAL